MPEYNKGAAGSCLLGISRHFKICRDIPPIRLCLKDGSSGYTVISIVDHEGVSAPSRRCSILRAAAEAQHC